MVEEPKIAKRTLEDIANEINLEVTNTLYLNELLNTFIRTKESKDLYKFLWYLKLTESVWASKLMYKHVMEVMEMEFPEQMEGYDYEEYYNAWLKKEFPNIYKK